MRDERAQLGVRVRLGGVRVRAAPRELGRVDAAGGGAAVGLVERERERLRVGEVEVERVELDGRHRVDRRAQQRGRQVVPRDVDEQPAPPHVRRVVDGEARARARAASAGARAGKSCAKVSTPQSAP